MQASQLLESTLKKIGNIVHDSVPVSKDEVDNKTVFEWGEIPKLEVDSTPGKCHHHEILHMIDGCDLKRGTRIAGHRAYYLKGPGVLLN